MNYIKKKIKHPLNSNKDNNNASNKDLEDDLYDEYVVEAPPHPSELIALGVNPEEIDINDPDKLRELYRKAKEEGKDKKVNSVLLAKQRQKEEIEEKKKTKEEWKFFDSITARVEQAVKESQKTLDQLKETSTVEKLSEPEYELRLTADQLFKSSPAVKQEKSADNWIDFGEGRGLVEQMPPADETGSGAGTGRRASDSARNPFAGERGAEKRLYHRNMSSFEAASLHLEHQLQQQQQQQAGEPNALLMNDIIGSGADPAQTDLIARMTADFQSAIETNDKEFAGASLTTNPFENFDPFETIVDDDISFPSPTPAEGKPPADTGADDKLNQEDPASFFNPFETLEDAPADEPEPEAAASNHLAEVEAGYVGLAAPNPTPIHAPAEHIKPEAMKESSTSVESVIEREPPSGVVEAAPAKPADSAKEKPADPVDEKPPGRFRGPPETSARPRPKPAARQLPAVQQVAEFQPIIPRTPAKKVNTSSEKRTKKRQKQKASRESDDDRDDEDSSDDSSDEDDKIRILIKARQPEVGGAEAGGEPAAQVPMPLLPPPPSRIMLMQQNREMSSSSSSREVRQANKLDSFEDLPIGKRAELESSDDGQDNKKAVEDNEEEDDDDEDEEKAKRGPEVEARPFVIPMTLSDDEEGAECARPDSPLFDDDTSYVLEEFPAKYEGPGWEMMLRYPPKKKLTANRFWKKIFVKLAQVPEVQAPHQTKAASKLQNSAAANGPPPPAGSENGPNTCVVLQIYDKREDKKPMQEIPIQATYTVSEINSQQFDQFGKIFTIRLDYIFYKERFGVRQGQLARFIHTGHIGSSTTSGGHGVDPISLGAIKRIGAPIEHSPQSSQIIKLGCSNYNDIREFKSCLEDYLFKMPISRDRALSTYKTEEVQMAVRDETYLELNQIGQIMKQLARVRLFFLSFLNGMPYIEVGINDIHRQGREVVGRMDILPVVTEEWIRLESCELHSTVDIKEFENPDLKMIKLTPPDATFFELMRFRVRPPRNRELPLQITANMSVTRTKVSINCDVMVPGCVSRKHGQIPCENIAIRIQIPDCWIYFFREEKHFRMGSKKSVNRRAGKVKGIERFLGGGGGLQDVNDDSSLIEVTSGQAKYEHHHNAIVWRAPRWPKDNQSAYVQNTMKIRLPLTAYDKMPESFYEFVHVEYTMPATTVSHTTLRSISVNPCDDEPPEKYVKYSAKYEYKVKMRLSVNTKPGGGASNQLPEPSPIVIMKQPDLQGDLQREEDINTDDDDDEDEAEERPGGESDFKRRELSRKPELSAQVPSQGNCSSDRQYSSQCYLLFGCKGDAL